MQVINYLYFIILTTFSLKYLFQAEGRVVNPLDSREYVFFEGPELFWVLLFSTGTIALSASGALDLQAIRLLSLEVMCLIGLMFRINRAPAFSIPAIIYAIYLLWLCTGMTYSPAPGYGFRVILKYLYSFIVLLFASAAVHNEEVFFKACVWARRTGALVAVLSIIPFGKFLFPGVFWYSTALAIHFIPLCIFSLALYVHYGHSKHDLAYALLFALPCVMWTFRTSIAGTMIALMIFFFFRYKLISLPYIAGVVILSLVLFFNVPAIKKKMFVNSEKVTFTDVISGNVEKDDINSNARFVMWEDLESRFFKPHPLHGNGIGSVQHYMYTNNVFGGLKQTHGDYVQMRCDSGLIGMYLYILIYISLIVHCFIIYISKHTQAIKVGALTAAAAMGGMAFCMYSDNTVTYSMATLFMPYGLYGMTLGLIKNES